MRRVVLLGAFLVSGLLVVIPPTPALALVRYVANTGTDSATCGPIASPCRSITRALANAADGDRIVVGPGRYGDVDRDGQFVSPGDEAGPSFCGGCVAITKAVTVESSAGAAATIIEIGNAATVVGIHAAGAVFGKRDKGFTVRGPGNGITVLADDVTVQANHVTGQVRGIVVDREKAVDPSDDAGVSILDNVVTGSESFGITILVAGVAVSGNVIQGCTEGIRVDGRTVIGDNHIVNNIRGIVIKGGMGTTIRRNVLAGHEQGAVYVGVFGDSDPTDTMLTSNNFANNGVLADPTADPTADPNCAVINFTPDSVNAERNFWGAASGPGPDPADRACATAGAIDTAPFLTRAVTIANQAGR